MRKIVRKLLAVGLVVLSIVVVIVSAGIAKKNHPQRKEEVQPGALGAQRQATAKPR